MSTPVTEGRGRRCADLAGTSAVGVSAALVAYFYYTGLYCSDDTRYLIGAIRIAIGEDISVTSLAERRVFLLLPAAAVYALTGSIDPAIAVYGLFFVALGLVAYVLSRRFFAPPAAVAAAALALAQPALFLYAGALMPDIAAALLLALALYFLCRWVAAEDAQGRRALAFAAASGAGIAAGFALKESSIVLVVVPAAAVAYGLASGRAARSVAAAAAMAAGFAGVLLLEALLFRLTAGQWYSSVASLLAPHDFSRYVEEQGRAPWARLVSLVGVLGPYTAMLFALAAAASIQLLRQCLSRRLAFRDASGWLMVAGFWAWPAFYFTFGTSSLSEYAPPVMQQRYYAPCIVPAALLAVRLLVSIPGAFGARPARLVGGAAACIALVAFLLAPYAERRARGLVYGAPAKEAFILAVRDAQHRYPQVPIVDSDSGWSTDLNRCRLLLSSAMNLDGDRLLETIRGRQDLRGRFDYPDPARLDPPFLLLGHDALLAPPERKSWLRPLQRRLDRGELRAERVGRYFEPAYRDLRGRRWMTRERAVHALAAEAPTAAGAPGPADGREHVEARHTSVDLYLFEQGTAD